MKKALLVLLALLLMWAPLQSYAHGSCGDEDQSESTQALGWNAASKDGDQLSNDPCDQSEGCSCCSLLCMQHCSACAQGIATYNGLITKSPATLWRPAVTLHYFSVILPTDTHPPQIPA
jgi:hypothetical protein